MQKLQLVNPSAVSLPVLVIVLFLVNARHHPSFLDTTTYGSGFVSISSDPWRPAVVAPTRAVARVPEECDMFRGEWVPDDEAPYYTNQSCALIQEHQNCIKYGRPDLGFLRWRWRPAECELPRFDAAGFLDVVRGRSLAFVGDSLARNHMQSLMCLLSKVEYPKDISKTKDQQFRTMRYESYNFTVSVFWSPFLVKANQSSHDGGGGRLWNLYLDEPDDAWVSGVWSSTDYVVISAANWFTRPSMFYESGRLVACHYCLVPGVPDLTLRYSLRMAFRTALRALTGGGFNGTAIVRTVSPTSHFEGGEWDKGGDCTRTRPYVNGTGSSRLAGLDLDFHTAQVEEFAEAAEKRKGRLMLMDTTEAMLLRPDGHPSRYGHWAHENVTLYKDCVHWCLPGPIDVWNEMLLQMILRSSVVR